MAPAAERPQLPACVVGRLQERSRLSARFPLPAARRRAAGVEPRAARGARRAANRTAGCTTGATWARTGGSWRDSSAQITRRSAASASRGLESQHVRRRDRGRSRTESGAQVAARLQALPVRRPAPPPAEATSQSGRSGTGVRRSLPRGLLAGTSTGSASSGSRDAARRYTVRRFSRLQSRRRSA
jgi:hypothetical protein